MLAGFCSAQTKLSSYNSSYFAKDYNVSVAEEKDKSLAYYVECATMDDMSKQATLILKESELEEFKTFIKSIKETYIKWTATAKENKVTELMKDIEYEKLKYSSAFSYGEWNFDFSTYLRAYYKIIDGKYLMIVRSDELQSSSNQFIKSKGFSIVFNSDKEFDEFLKAFDNEKAHKLFDEKRAKEDLFKN
jgi:hypothetical protein